MPDNEIDFRDIPAMDDGFWKNAVCNPFYKPNKTSPTVRVDADVLALRVKARAIRHKSIPSCAKSCCAPHPKV